MVIEKPKVRGLVHAGVSEIKCAGVEPTVDDIAWLIHVSEKCVLPSQADSLEMMEVPVHCGRTVLWPLTVGADIWLRECVEQWWDRDDHPWIVAMCELYAFANGRDPDAFTNLYTKRKARSAVLWWAARSLPVSYKQIRLSMMQLAGAVEYVRIADNEIVKHRDVDPYDWGEEISLLCAVYKKPPRHFLFDVSFKQVVRMLERVAYSLGRPDLIDRDKKTEKYKDISFGKYRMVVREIIRRGKGDAGQADTEEMNEPTTPTT